MLAITATSGKLGNILTRAATSDLMQLASLFHGHVLYCLQIRPDEPHRWSSIPVQGPREGWQPG